MRKDSKDEVRYREEYGFKTKHNPWSEPSEIEGTDEVGIHTYLHLVRFGAVPLKSPGGYEIKVTRHRSPEDFRSELIGHVADAIDSEEQLTTNGINWTKLNYKVFLVAQEVSVTMAITSHGDYGFAVTAFTGEIDQILSTFRFLNNPSKAR